jgi:hypothetical protein
LNATGTWSVTGIVNVAGVMSTLPRLSAAVYLNVVLPLKFKSGLNSSLDACITGSPGFLLMQFHPLSKFRLMDLAIVL